MFRQSVLHPAFKRAFDRGRWRALSHSAKQVGARHVTRPSGNIALLTSFSVITYALCSNREKSFIKNDLVRDLKRSSICASEVLLHNKEDDCWVVIDDFVYDLTNFINQHPGGPAVIKFNAGKDVTALFSALHAPDVIEKFIPDSDRLGPLEGHMPSEHVCPPPATGESPEDIQRKEELRHALPDLDSLMNLYDFENLASQILSNMAWAYYSSAADDEFTHRENHAIYHRVFFKPRVLVDVTEVDLSTEMLGSKVSVPFYASATALVKLGNPKEGEKDIARGCGQGEYKCAQMISTFASCSLREIVEAAPSKEQTQWLQLYVNTNRSATENLLKEAESLGLKAIFVTVDTPASGRREKDMKIKFSSKNAAPNAKSAKGGSARGASQALAGFIDPSLTWEDITDLKEKTHLPIVVKGVQCVEDILKAVEIGVDGVVISNHGGRQLDFARAPLEVLAEAMPILREQRLDDKLEVFIDGGVRRGTDILKALCLGAKGVGIGRPFLYANSCYGKDGVEKAINMLAEEVECSMRLLGAKTIKDLRPELLDLSGVKNRYIELPGDSLYQAVYQKPEPARFVER
ncbi:LADA_0E00254g1_1 [Lachancea dasiensis]|uniref:L-lactate dehydrogenase (cytochrome) n=1 Tax=Lachancea dasiensis TaxID=1072105 RepID=A0A1G4JAF3_9SACH|nr:LADA_0E00254g1_1 [Lachancea dasiensis]